MVERNLYQQEDSSAPIQNWVFDPFERVDDQDRATRITDLDREPGTHSPSDDLPLKEAIANLERARLLDALDASRWHQARAAERLGLSYHQMRALLRIQTLKNPRRYTLQPEQATRLLVSSSLTHL